MSSYDHVGKPTMGERIKESIPGTDEYRATHGVTGAHVNAEKMKAHIPGTEEHRLHEAGVIGGGHNNVPAGERMKQNIPGTREYQATHGATDAHRGVEQMKALIPGTEEHHIRQGTHANHMGVVGAPAGMGTAGMGATGPGHTGHQQETLGHKVKKIIPGTREHEEKKIQEGRF